MSTTHPHLGRTVGIGAGLGIAASAIMAMYAMAASYCQDHGFFTPLFHIASLLISPNQLMASMRGAMVGHSFHFALGAAILGALIHMMTGAMFGALFMVILVRIRLRGVALVAGGMAYGTLVFSLSAFIGLPLAAAIFDSGDQITHMARMVGWWTFAIEHIMFGATLGLLALRTRRA